MGNVVGIVGFGVMRLSLIQNDPTSILHGVAFFDRSLYSPMIYSRASTSEGIRFWKEIADSVAKASDCCSEFSFLSFLSNFYVLYVHDVFASILFCDRASLANFGFVGRRSGSRKCDCIIG